VDEPVPISEVLPEAILRIMRPDLLEAYQEEKERHREELKDIERAMKRARQMLKRLFGKLRVQREGELEAEYLERTQEESDRHDRFLLELKETIRDHWAESPPADERGGS
jgi:hypothetical protein